MIQFSLEHKGTTLDAWITNTSEEPRSWSSMTVGFASLSILGPIHAACHITTGWFRPMRGFRAWFLAAPLGREKAELPARAWQRRTEAEVRQIPVVAEDVGKLALVWDTSWLFELLSVNPADWKHVGRLPYVWPSLVLEPGVPVHLMTLQGESSLDDITVGTLITRVFLNPLYGFRAQQVAWKEVQFGVNPVSLADNRLETLRLLQILLESEEPQIERALSVINDAIGDDE